MRRLEPSSVATGGARNIRTAGELLDLFVVHNPLAGDGSWTRDRLERTLRDAGHSFTIVDAKADWPGWIAGVTPDVFVAVGGDGTFQRLAVAVAGRPQPIAIVPTGTANNVARAVGDAAPLEPQERIARWGDREEVLHLAEARVGSSRRPFVEVAGAGAFARLLGRAPSVPASIPRAAELFAGRQWLVEEILRCEPKPATITIDGAVFEDDFLLIACLNLPAFGARVELAPAESASSTLLTVCAVPGSDRLAFADWLVDPESSAARWHLARGQTVSLTTAAPTHVDDRIWPMPGRRREMRLTGGLATVRVWG